MVLKESGIFEECTQFILNNVRSIDLVEEGLSKHSMFCQKHNYLTYRFVIESIQNNIIYSIRERTNRMKFRFLTKPYKPFKLRSAEAHLNRFEHKN